MLGQYLITFREVLEATLILGIILAFLVRTDKKDLSRYIWTGAIIAVIASIVIGLVIGLVFGGLDEASIKLFEGVAALIAVVVLTSMIIWMAIKGRDIKGEMDKRIDKVLKTGTTLGLIGLGFIVVFREGLETVLFLTPFGATDPGGTIAGATLGLISALLLSILIYIVGVKIDLKRFFYFTSLILILLAAGLAGYGVHELLEYQEAVGGDPGWWGVLAYNLNIAKDDILYHKGAVGSIFAVLFGYSVKMEWARVIVHVTYLAIFLPLTILAYVKPHGWFSKKFLPLTSRFCRWSTKRSEA